MSAVRTHSRHSALATGTALDAPKQSFLSRIVAIPVGWLAVSGPSPRRIGLTSYAETGRFT